MADIKGANARQVYDMTYRLIDQQATITTAQEGAREGKIMGGTWKANDKSLNFMIDNLGYSVNIPFDQIMIIRLSA